MNIQPVPLTEIMTAINLNKSELTVLMESICSKMHLRLAENAKTYNILTQLWNTEEQVM